MRKITWCCNCRNWKPKDNDAVRARCSALEIIVSKDFFCAIYRHVDRCPLCGTPGFGEEGKPHYRRCARPGCMVDRFCVQDIKPSALVVEPGMQDWVD